MHLGVATWLEDFAQDRFDEYVELIAYHYREALVLGRRSGATSAATVDPARAVAALERAGEIAGRAGAGAEAHRYLESAIAIADEAERGRLYEKLGDGLFWGDSALKAYGEALQRWRQAGGERSRSGRQAPAQDPHRLPALAWHRGTSDCDYCIADRDARRGPASRRGGGRGGTMALPGGRRLLAEQASLRGR